MKAIENKQKYYYGFVESFAGKWLLVANDKALVYVGLEKAKYAWTVNKEWISNTEIMRLYINELTLYFSGELESFSLPLAPQGTDFQKKVWQALTAIPYGETWNYKQLATAIGKPQAARAVGAANGRNPISIVIPCHRVIGANGKLTGYAGGLDTKQKLLAMESKTKLLI